MTGGARKQRGAQAETARGECITAATKVNLCRSRRANRKNCDGEGGSGDDDEHMGDANPVDYLTSFFNAVKGESDESLSVSYVSKGKSRHRHGGSVAAAGTTSCAPHQPRHGI